MCSGKISILLLVSVTILLVGSVAGYNAKDVYAEVNTSAQATLTVSPINHVVFDMSDNNRLFYMEQDSIFSIQLDENPTTGYHWVATTTKGLNIFGSMYTPYKPIMCGSGGIHEWYINANRSGLQEFSAVYMRPWMNTTADDLVYTIDIQVTPSYNFPFHPVPPPLPTPPVPPSNPYFLQVSPYAG